MAEITNKYKIQQKTGTNDVTTLHPETDADIVIFNDSKAKLGTQDNPVDNVQEAIEVLKNKIEDQISGLDATVTSVTKVGDVITINGGIKQVDGLISDDETASDVALGTAATRDYTTTVANAANAADTKVATEKAVRTELDLKADRNKTLTKVEYKDKNGVKTFTTTDLADTPVETDVVNITTIKADMELNNLTNDRQVKGLASGTKEDNILVWGADGYTVKDGGKSIQDIVDIAEARTTAYVTSLAQMPAFDSDSHTIEVAADKLKDQDGNKIDITKILLGDAFYLIDTKDPSTGEEYSDRWVSRIIKTEGVATSIELTVLDIDSEIAGYVPKTTKVGTTAIGEGISVQQLNSDLNIGAKGDAASDDGSVHARINQEKATARAAEQALTDAIGTTSDTSATNTVYGHLKAEQERATAAENAANARINAVKVKVGPTTYTNDTTTETITVTDVSAETVIAQATPNANAVTNVAYDAATRKITATKGTEFIETGKTITTTGAATGSATLTNSGATIDLTLADSGVTAGTYSAVKVNAKGIVTDAGQIIEVGAAEQTTPSQSLVTGGIFFKRID